MAEAEFAEYELAEEGEEDAEEGEDEDDDGGAVQLSALERMRVLKGASARCPSGGHPYLYISDSRCEPC